MPKNTEKKLQSANTIPATSQTKLQNVKSIIDHHLKDPSFSAKTATTSKTFRNSHLANHKSFTAATIVSKTMKDPTLNAKLSSTTKSLDKAISARKDSSKYIIKKLIKVCRRHAKVMGIRDTFFLVSLRLPYKSRDQKGIINMILNDAKKRTFVFTFGMTPSGQGHVESPAELQRRTSFFNKLYEDATRIAPDLGVKPSSEGFYFVAKKKDKAQPFILLDVLAKKYIDTSALADRYIYDDDYTFCVDMVNNTRPFSSSSSALKQDVLSILKEWLPFASPKESKSSKSSN